MTPITTAMAAAARRYRERTGNRPDGTLAELLWAVAVVVVMVSMSVFLHGCVTIQKTLDQVKADCNIHQSQCILCKAGETWQGSACEVSPPMPRSTPTSTPATTPSSTSTPTPTPLPTDTPLGPTRTPPPVPTPTALPVNCVPKPSENPVSIAQPKRCPAGYREVAFFGEPGVMPPAGYATLCGANKCGDGHAADGTPYYPNDCTWWRIGDGLRHGNALQLVKGAWVKHEVLGTGADVCVDGLGRRYDDCSRLYPTGPIESFPDGAAGPWTSLGYAMPDFCPDVTPTPAPTVSGPTPTPGAFPPQPEDFRINFVNACSVLRYTKHLENGLCRGECDGTYRFIGTLRSTGERYGNTSDRDHWHCAIEACPGITPDELEQHRKTCELVGCREWVSLDGVELHVQGAISVDRDDENPYKHLITAPCDAAMEIYGCVPPGARTTDGLPIPGGQGCGGPKTVRFE